MLLRLRIHRDMHGADIDTAAHATLLQGSLGNVFCGGIIHCLKEASKGEASFENPQTGRKTMPGSWSRRVTFQTRNASSVCQDSNNASQVRFFAVEIHGAFPKS